MQPQNGRVPGRKQLTSHPQAAIAAHQPSRWTASAASLQRVERILFALTVMAAAGMMWLAPHLPMSDLAQHAGQVALWRDLLTGQSPWTEFVRINLMTPYLIGYGLMLPLSFVFSMETTTRIAVTLGFLGFVAVARGLRREFGSDKRLDWLFLLSFFGHAWKWGFLTYLVASPVGLIFLLLAHRNSSQPSPWRAVLLAATGSLLLFCHGLVFLVMVSLGGLLALAMTWENWPKSLALRLLPFVWLVALALGFRLATADIQGAFQMEGFAFGLPLPQRPGALLVWLTDMDTFALYLPLASIAVLMYPKFLRLQANSRPVLVLVGGFVVLLAIVPTDGFSTGLLLDRKSVV